MENRIEIKVIDSASRLLGYKYGQKIYTNQIESKLDMTCKNTLVFPETIEGVSIWFIEGILSKLPKEIPRKEFFKYFAIDGKDAVVNKFFDVVLL